MPKFVRFENELAKWSNDRVDEYSVVRDKTHSLVGMDGAVLYFGAGADIIFPLVALDQSDYIFVDYKNEHEAVKSSLDEWFDKEMINNYNKIGDEYTFTCEGANRRITLIESDVNTVMDTIEARNIKYNILLVKAFNTEIKLKAVAKSLNLLRKPGLLVEDGGLFNMNVTGAGSSYLQEAYAGSIQFVHHFTSNTVIGHSKISIYEKKRVPQISEAWLKDLSEFKKRMLKIIDLALIAPEPAKQLKQYLDNSFIEIKSDDFEFLEIILREGRDPVKAERIISALKPNAIKLAL